MSTEMIMEAVRKQFAAADEALRAWRQEDVAGGANLASAADAIVILLDRPSILRRVVERVLEHQRAGQVPNLLATWQDISILFELTKRQVYPLLERVNQAQKTGCKIERAEEFERAVRGMEELYESFRMTFPVATDEEAAEDRAAIARGEYVDAEEAFARIAGVDVETWRRRVAAHESAQGD